MIFKTKIIIFRVESNEQFEFVQDLYFGAFLVICLIVEAGTFSVDGGRIEDQRKIIWKVF